MSATIHGLLLKGPMVRAALNSKLDTWPPVALDPGRAVKGWTRRVVTRHNSQFLGWSGDKKPVWDDLDLEAAEPKAGPGVFKAPMDSIQGGVAALSPRIRTGHLIYFKETWAGLRDEGLGIDPRTGEGFQVAFSADVRPGGDADRARLDYGIKWRSAMLMPKKLARLWLRVMEIKAQRIQDISAEDARLEGLTQLSKDGRFGIPDRDGWPGGYDEGWHWRDWEADPVLAFRRLWNGINAAPKPKGGKKPTHFVSYPWDQADRDPRTMIRGLPHICIPNPPVWAFGFKRVKRPEGLT